MVQNIKKDLKTFNYKCRKVQILLGLVFKKTFSRDMIRWHEVLSYIFLKNIIFETVKRQHLSSVEALI